MSLIQFLRILLARWKMILATFLACLVVASTVAMLLPKRYPATARVLMDMGRADPVTGQLIGRDRSYAKTQMELIRDMRVAGAVVDRLGLANNPDMIASYEASGRSAVDGGMRAWIGRSIIQNTRASMIPGSSIMEITYESNTPEQAKQVVGVIRDAYVQESLRFRTDAASQSGSWFQEQAEKARAALLEAEAKVGTYMRANNIVVVDGKDGDSAKLSQLQAALQQARGMQSSADTAVANRMATDPLSDQLQMQLATIEDEMALAGARLGTEHPGYKALVARRNTVAGQLNQARARSNQSIAAMSGTARQSVAQLEAQVAAQEALVLERKPVLDEFMRLLRDVELKRSHFDRANARTDDLQLQASVADGGIVILGDPVGSSTPSYPKVNLIVFLSALVGLALGVIGAVLAEFMARRVRGYEDLAFASGAPVMVTVGAAETSPLRSRLHRLFGRRDRSEPSTDLQAI